MVEGSQEMFPPYEKEQAESLTQYWSKYFSASVVLPSEAIHSLR